MTTIMRGIMQRRRLGESRAIKQHQPKACGEHYRQYFVFPSRWMRLRIGVIE